MAHPAQRIITLAPNLAKLVYAAGAGEKMVAATRNSDYSEVVKKLPLVGDAFALNLERIATLKPDPVLVWLSGTPERQRSALKALAKRQGFAVFCSPVWVPAFLQAAARLCHTIALARAPLSSRDTSGAARQSGASTPGRRD